MLTVCRNARLRRYNSRAAEPPDPRVVELMLFFWNKNVAHSENHLVYSKMKVYIPLILRWQDLKAIYKVVMFFSCIVPQSLLHMHLVSRSYMCNQTSPFVH